MSSASGLNVSLEPHLIEALQPLIAILPQGLSANLSQVLSSAASSTPATADDPAALIVSGASSSHRQPLIPYSLLSAISTWTRSPDGRDALASCDPPLDPSSYAMVSLLAGTRTSPEKNFPDVPPKPDSGKEALKEVNDRRAVTAVLNALLSVLGSGVATWWAADRLRWKDEWVSSPLTCLSPEAESRPHLSCTAAICR